MHELSKRLELEYKEVMNSYIKGKKDSGMFMPAEPPMRMLVIPANSSASSFLEILGDNDGIGLLFESEGDTLSQTLKSDYGNYSDVLRKAFHHKLVSLSRRKDREYCEVSNPRVSVALAGTPEQVRRLIPDAENGLMSRFCFYIIRFKRGIRNVFATSDISQSKNAMFKLLGDKFCHQHEEFVRQGNYSFSFPSDLQEHFIEYLSRVNEECCNEVDNKMQGVVRRMELIAYRIMMVLTAVRHLDNVLHEFSSDETVQLVCHKFDYSIAMSICETLLCHSVFIYPSLSGNQSKRFNTATPETGVYARRNTIYNMLSDIFTKKDYDALVLALGENGSTANKWIETFIKDGKLCRIEQGKYRRIFEWQVCVLVSLKPMRQAIELPLSKKQFINIENQYEYKGKKLGGRPKLVSYQKRTKCFRIMFTENDYIYIQSKAEQAGLSVNEFCHQAAMDCQVCQRISPEMVSVIRDLSGIVNNVNQITHQMHIYGLETVKQQCFTIISEVSRIITQVKNTCHDSKD